MADREVVATPLDSLSDGVAGQLDEACCMYRDLCDQEAAIKAAKDGLMDEVIRPLMKSNGLDKVVAPKWLGQRVTRVSSKIVPEILLGEGVPMAIVKKATTSTTSEYFTVTKPPVPKAVEVLGVEVGS